MRLSELLAFRRVEFCWVHEPNLVFAGLRGLRLLKNDLCPECIHEWDS